MKILSLVLAILGMASAATAQTNSSPYVPKAEDMRIVEGKMYNRVLSTNWTTLPSTGTTYEVMDKISEGVLLKPQGAGTKTVLIKHHTSEKALAKGKTVKTSFRALKVSDFKYGNESVAAYDCGLANTEENRKVLQNGPIHSAKK